MSNYWGSSYGTGYSGYSGYGAGYGSTSRWNYYNDNEDLMEEGTENDGRIGLSNIGNTCYMNSALQCVMHNDLLKAFFLNPNVEKEINENNPLGTKGSLFKEVRKLFQSYYRTRGTKVTPSKFKAELGTQNAMFEGYQQHDSQEFWLYLIDMIHEDSNRILSKPYVATIEGKGQEPDLELGRRSWIAHLQRNYSIITDNFNGQFKSRVDCTTPDCGNTSVTFDPFTIISLSIPNIVSGRFDFYMSAADSSSELFESSFNAQSTNNFMDLKVKSIREGLARKNNKNPDLVRIAMFTIQGEGMVFEDGDSLGRIQEKRGYGFVGKPALFLAEINEVDATNARQPNSLVVYFSVKREAYDFPPEKKGASDDTWGSYYSYGAYSSKKTAPWDETQYGRFLYITGSSTIRDLHVAVLRKLYYASSLNAGGAAAGGDKLTQADFQTLWARMEAAGSTERFFYLKHEDRLLSKNLLNETIDAELAPKAGRLDIKVYIRSAERTSVTFDLNQKTHYESYTNYYIKKDDDFASTTLGEFKDSMSLENLLQGFEKTEVLDEENLWRCSACKKEVAAKKSMWIYKAPNYLTVHFKKIKGHHNKVPLVSFPMVLDMDKYVLNKENMASYDIKVDEFMQPKDLDAYKAQGVDPAIKPIQQVGNKLTYKLYGIVNHYGSQNFGHYTSACEVGQEWFDFNDSTVSPTSAGRLVSEDAYILFYKRL